MDMGTEAVLGAIIQSTSESDGSSQLKCFNTKTLFCFSKDLEIANIHDEENDVGKIDLHASPTQSDFNLTQH